MRPVTGHYDIDSGFRRRRTWLLVLGIILGLAIGAIIVFKIVNNPESSTKAVKNSQPPQPKPVEVRGRYLFAGTIFWARRVQTWSAKPDGSLDYAYPFSQLGTFNRAVYDGWEADLECPATTTEVPMAQQENQLIFNCKPEFLPEAARFFDIINLANNHTDNMGRSGLNETRQAIVKNDMQPIGDYEPSLTGDTCEIVSLKVHVLIDNNSETEGKLPVAFCSWHYFYRLPLAGEIEAMQKYAKIMPVFAFVHMGVEYKAKADPIQQSVAHKIADQGPEFVIANNPHWVQNTEVYNGKLIVYSTGNFIFDQQYDKEVTRSVSIDVKTSLKYDQNVAGWLKLGATCEAYKDDCYNQAIEKGLTKPKLKLTYDAVAGDNSAKLTHKAAADIQAAVLQRTNWTETLKLLGQTGF